MSLNTEHLTPNPNPDPELYRFLFDTDQSAAAALEELPIIAQAHQDQVQQFLNLPFEDQVTNLSSVLEGQSELEDKLYRVYSYAYVRYYQAVSPENEKMTTQVRGVWSDMYAGYRLLTQWLDTLTESNLLTLKGALTDSDLKFYLEKLMVSADYRQEDLNLEKSLQQRAIQAGNLAQNRATLFGQMTSLLNEQGQSFSQLQQQFRHPDSEIRQQAYQRFYQLFDELEPDSGKTYLELYFNLYRDMLLEYQDIYVNGRGYDDLLHYRNVSNLLPNQAVESLIEVVTSQPTTDLFAKFFDLKGKFLGEKVTRDGIYAPSSYDKSLSFEEAAVLIKQAYESIDPEFAEVVEQMIAGNRVDHSERDDKIPGAYNFYLVPGQLSVIIMSYQRNMASYGYLAHELGHSIHMSEVGNEHQRMLTYKIPQPVSEIASTMGELVAFDKLLDQPDLNIEQRISILINRLSEIHKNVVRQAHSIVFETQALEAIQSDTGYEELNKLFLENLQSQVGPRVEVDSQYGAEWAWWSHLFDEPFGNYKYSFAQLIALSLYAKYQSGELEAADYGNLLQLSATTMPEDLLKQVGIEINDPSFWQAGIELISTWVDELEKLLVEDNLNT